MNESYSFTQLIKLVKKKYQHDKDFTEYCVEPTCFNPVERFGMFCGKHSKES